MKTIESNRMRRALAVLTAGMVLGGALAVTAQNTMTEPSVYYVKNAYPPGTLAPYNAGGGIDAQALLTATNVTSTNITLSWFGTMGWYAVNGSPNLLNWTTLTNVESQNFTNTVTVATTDGVSGSFYLNQANSFAGQGQCGSCHGDKYTPWLGTEHATAYATLAAIGQNNNTECILCHTVGYGQPTGFTNASTTAYLENVGCEDCHGPASWHKNSDHDVILPVVSLDPAICGSCHQGAEHPTYQEYTNVNYTNITVAPAGVLYASMTHSLSSGSSGFTCSFCHAANNRMIMLNETLDMQAGNPHPVTLWASSSDAGVWTAACATCHDPHASNEVAQLRYPTFSTNYFTYPVLGDTRSVVVTNYGVLQTNSVNYNTVMDNLYNPKVQVCGQCHNGRGTRWNGTAYYVITNTPMYASSNIVAYVSTYCTNYNTEVFTNSAGVPFQTNTYTVVYECGREAVTNVTLVQTNPLYSVGAIEPIIPFTNNSVIGYTTNSSGFSSPHPNPQYRVLIGQLDYDYASVAGVPNVLNDAHELSPNQCADCHVPQYSVTGGTVTGHSFVSDYNGCLASCHSGSSVAALQADTANFKQTVTNSITRVVSLLTQWSTNIAPAILQTNYGPVAWEFPSPGKLGGTTTAFKSGPPSGYNYKYGNFPSGTNDDLQLEQVPQDIRIARFSLYMIYDDQSLGVHNPTYVTELLADAENRVANQFANGGYAPYFTASTLSGFAPLNVSFTNPNYTSGACSWKFGDGGTTNIANPSYTYNTPGLYSVTCTVNGAPLTRTDYIWVQAQPVVSFTANATNITHGSTVTFTNTSSNAGSVYRWAWSPMSGVSGAPTYYTTNGNFSFTYTNAGTYNVALQAYCPGGSANTVGLTNAPYITAQ